MEKLLAIARKSADQAEVYFRATDSHSVSFENAKLKDIESSMQSGVSLRVFKNGKVGTAYTQNLIDREELVRNALASLRGGVEGNYELPLTANLPQLSSYDSAIEKLTNTELVNECTRICESLSTGTKTQVNASARRTVQRIRLLNTRGNDLKEKFSSYVCSAGAIFPGSYASISLSHDGKSFTLFPQAKLDYITETYNKSVKEVKPAGGRMKVLFLAESLYALIWRLAMATNGKNFFEKTSRLKDQIGHRVLSDKLTITDEPLDDTFPNARSFDDEGTACRNLTLFDTGVFRDFYCDLFYASKLGTASTGHGYRGDIMNKPVPSLEHLVVKPGDKSFSELIGMIDRGVIVGGAMGAHSGNILNGDYSIGLSPGIYVENGEIAGRVKDAMVAGNVYDTMAEVIALENELHSSYMGRFPAVLFDDVSVALGG